jgi:hypothetical protein
VLLPIPIVSFLHHIVYSCISVIVYSITTRSSRNSIVPKTSIETIINKSTIFYVLALTRFRCAYEDACYSEMKLVNSQVTRTKARAFCSPVAPGSGTAQRTTHVSRMTGRILGNSNHPSAPTSNRPIPSLFLRTRRGLHLKMCSCSHTARSLSKNSHKNPRSCQNPTQDHAPWPKS